MESACDESRGRAEVRALSLIGKRNEEEDKNGPTAGQRKEIVCVCARV